MLSPSSSTNGLRLPSLLAIMSRVMAPEHGKCSWLRAYSAGFLGCQIRELNDKIMAQRRDCFQRLKSSALDVPVDGMDHLRFSGGE